MQRRAAWLFFVGALCLSCQGEKFAEGRLMFRELLTLRDELAKEFEEKIVDVSVGGNDRMTVKFIDSPLHTRGDDEKQRRADAVADFVAAHYKRRVASVSIQFVSGGGGANAGQAYLGRTTPKSNS